MNHSFFHAFSSRNNSTQIDSRSKWKHFCASRHARVMAKSGPPTWPAQHQLYHPLFQMVPLPPYTPKPPSPVPPCHTTIPPPEKIDQLLTIRIMPFSLPSRLMQRHCSGSAVLLCHMRWFVLKLVTCAVHWLTDSTCQTPLTKGSVRCNPRLCICLARLPCFVPRLTFLGLSTPRVCSPGTYILFCKDGTTNTQTW